MEARLKWKLYMLNDIFRKDRQQVIQGMIGVGRSFALGLI